MRKKRLNEFFDVFLLVLNFRQMAANMAASICRFSEKTANFNEEEPGKPEKIWRMSRDSWPAKFRFDTAEHELSEVELLMILMFSMNWLRMKLVPTLLWQLVGRKRWVGPAHAAYLWLPIIDFLRRTNNGHELSNFRILLNTLCKFDWHTDIQLWSGLQWPSSWNMDHGSVET